MLHYRDKSFHDGKFFTDEKFSQLGAGEILVSVVDAEGTLAGPDKEAVALISSIGVPVTYSGGISLRRYLPKWRNQE